MSVIVLVYVYWYMYDVYYEVKFYSNKMQNFIKTIFFQETASEMIWFKNYYV